MKRRNVILAVVVLIVVMGTIAPVALGAKTGGKETGKQQVLDPFTLRLLDADDGGETALRVTEAELTRQTIRIPQRPPMRSAFRPTY